VKEIFDLIVKLIPFYLSGINRGLDKEVEAGGPIEDVFK
jgi:hypothetical protein